VNVQEAKSSSSSATAILLGLLFFSEMVIRGNSAVNIRRVFNSSDTRQENSQEKQAPV
jgi:hypothetical protein